VFFSICAVALATLPAAADEDAGPIVLTNEDVTRLHARPGQPADAVRQDVGSRAPTAVEGASPPADDLAVALALEADLRARLDRISQQSMGSVEQSIDNRVSRVSQRQLQDAALNSSSRASAPAAPMPGGAHADSDAGDADAEIEAPADEPEPACMYGTRGRLIFEPEGRSCDPIRATSQRTFASGSSAAKGAKKPGSVGCVYGSRGQLLYSSRGVECAKLEDD
jgi:hypothetical protein